ncbi:MAG: ATP-binding protein, partial [Myxococcota bacterium]|nr:ATP-binding protein [Myxococcota bacterium]
MPEREDELELTSQGGLDTLVDLRIEAAGSTNSSLGAMPSIVFDPNRFRLERMLQREHLVYGVPTPFVGREQAREQLKQILKDTEASGRLHVTTVTGDAGLGKTRLLAEVFASSGAIDRGVEIVGTCCSESEAPEGIAVVSQLLRSRFKVALNMSALAARSLVRAEIEPLVDAGYLDMAASQLGYLMGLDVPLLADEAPRPEDRERYQ